jgi:hypothetical protein
MPTTALAPSAFQNKLIQGNPNIGMVPPNAATGSMLSFRYHFIYVLLLPT